MAKGLTTIIIYIHTWHNKLNSAVTLDTTAGLSHLVPIACSIRAWP